MKRITILILLLLLGVVYNVAAQVEFSVKTPRVVATGDPFRVEFASNNIVENFTPPSFDGFRVIAGPSTSQGTSVQYVNGQMSKTVSFTITYVVIAESEGNFTIPPASGIIDGKEYKTEPYQIEVVNEANSGSQSSSAGSSTGGATQGGGSTAAQSSNSQSGTIASDDILLRTEVSSRSVYRGQPITAKLMLYARRDISSAGNIKVAAFNGFWKYDFQPQSPGNERKTYNGKVYDVYTVREFLLFPQKSGELEIEGMELTVAVAMLTSSPSSSLLNNFFGGMQSYTNVEKKLVSPPVKIDVKALPAGAPASFTGAVGSFTISSNLSNSKIAANSSATLSYTLKGSGNMPLITAPEVNLPGSFELYPAKTIDNFSQTTSNVSGSKVFEYPFIARAVGDYEIKGLEFSYFDTSSGSYKTLTTPDLYLEVEGDSSRVSSGTTGLISGVNKEDLRILGEDIHFIKQGNPTFTLKGSYLMGSAWYFLILLLIIIAFVAILIYMKKRIKELRDTVKVKSKKANKVALSRLKTARKYKSEDSKTEFYTEMLRVLMGYVGDKLNIEVAKLSKDYINEQLTLKNVDITDVELLLKTISDCEFAQYAPSASADMENIYQSTLELIGRLESKL